MQKILFGIILVIFSPLYSAELLFSSGFEAGVYLGKPYNDGGGTWYQDIKGADSSGFKWPIELWSSKGAFQVLVNSKLNSAEYIENRVDTVTGPYGNPTRAMYSKIYKSDKEWTQDPYIIEDAKEEGDLYVRYWLKFPKKLESLLGSDGWCTFFEWKTKGDYRIAAYVYKDKDGKPYWYAHGDNMAKDNLGKYNEFWYEENRKIPVLAGKWFLVEIFWHRSKSSDGRFWLAVNGKTVVDHHGKNKLNKSINRIMLFTTYAGKYPFYQWVDDVVIYNGFPCGEGKSCYDSLFKQPKPSINNNLLRLIPVSDPLNKFSGTDTYLTRQSSRVFIYDVNGRFILSIEPRYLPAWKHSTGTYMNRKRIAYQPYFMVFHKEKTVKRLKLLPLK